MQFRSFRGRHLPNDEHKTDIHGYKIKTFRWLFYISSFQLLVFFASPVLIYPAEILLYMEILAALTVGVIFALFFVFVNIYGLLVDRGRKRLYITMAILMGCWNSDRYRWRRRLPRRRISTSCRRQPNSFRHSSR